MTEKQQPYECSELTTLYNALQAEICRLRKLADSVLDMIDKAKGHDVMTASGPVSASAWDEHVDRNQDQGGVHS